MDPTRMELMKLAHFGSFNFQVLIKFAQSLFSQKKIVIFGRHLTVCLRQSEILQMSQTFVSVRTD
jgi:anti-anti-sigma regulatory factor